MQTTIDYLNGRVGDLTGDLWVWFDSLTREEWLIVLAACCAVGFLLMKNWLSRGPC